MSNRIDLLNTAISLTGGDRNKDYGSPVDNMEHIGAIYDAIVDDTPVTSAEAVVITHIATKLARMKTSPLKSDHYVDAMAYLGILWEVRYETDKKSQELESEAGGGA